MATYVYEQEGYSAMANSLKSQIILYQSNLRLGQGWPKTGHHIHTYIQPFIHPGLCQ